MDSNVYFEVTALHGRIITLVTLEWLHSYNHNSESMKWQLIYKDYQVEPQAVAVSPYGWLMTYYGWLAGLSL